MLISGGWCGVMVARKITTSRKRSQWLVFGGCGWWWWPEGSPTTENEHNCSFSGGVGGVGGCGGQRKAQPPKTSGHARFRCVWMVVVARGGPNHRKRALTLVFGGCGWWWWPEEGPAPENERSCSFSGWCWQEEGPTLENERLCSFSRGVGVGVGQRKVQPPKTSAMARFRGGGVGGWWWWWLS
jgi:hypothetical protein